MFEKVEAALVAMLPVGKALAWIVGVACSMFLAGVGFMAAAGDFTGTLDDVSELRDSIVPELRREVRLNTSTIRSLQGDLRDSDANQRKILCLVELQTDAQAQNLTPIAFNRRMEACQDEGANQQ